MEANDAGTQEAALAFMRDSPEVWGTWLADVDPAVTDRVLGTLR